MVAVVVVVVVVLKVDLCNAAITDCLDSLTVRSTGCVNSS